MATGERVGWQLIAEPAIEASFLFTHRTAGAPAWETSVATDSNDELAAAFHGGCCSKPARKSSSALAEVHVRAAVRDDVGTDRPLATTGMAVFGAHP